MLNGYKIQVLYLPILQEVYQFIEFSFDNIPTEENINDCKKFVNDNYKDILKSKTFVRIYKVYTITRTDFIREIK